MLGVMQRTLVLGFGWLLCTQVARAESFDQIVEAYGGAAAFDIILVQDCSVIDNSSEAALDQEYSAKLCPTEDESSSGGSREYRTGRGDHRSDTGLVYRVGGIRIFYPGHRH